MQRLAVGQHKKLLPRARDPLHIHHDDAVAGEHHLIAHRLVCAHDLLALQQQGVNIFADILLLQAHEVLHRFIAEFHCSVPLSAVLWLYCSISAAGLQDDCPVQDKKKRPGPFKVQVFWSG